MIAYESTYPSPPRTRVARSIVSVPIVISRVVAFEAIRSGDRVIIAVLLTLAFAPLLLLGAVILADRAGLKGADRILDWTMVALIQQWRIGCLVNIVGGLAFIAGGIYFGLVRPGSPHWIAALLTIPLGLWRFWRGLSAWPVDAEEPVQAGNPHDRT